jgi:hypothetical protein
MTATQNAAASVAPELWKKTPSGSISWALTNGAISFWRNSKQKGVALRHLFFTLLL